MHGFLLEFGISLPVGKTAVTRLAAVFAMQELPPRLVAILERLHQHFKHLEEQIGEIDRELARQLAEDEVGQRLISIPGVGRSPQARWPRNWATQSGTDAVAILRHRLGSFPGNAAQAARPIFSISAGAVRKMLGRRLLVLCARAYMRGLEKRTGRLADWVRAMLAQRHPNVVACALANELAQTAWAIVARQTTFDAGFTSHPL